MRKRKLMQIKLTQKKLMQRLSCKLLSALLCTTLLAGSIEPAVMQAVAGEVQATESNKADSAINKQEPGTGSGTEGNNGEAQEPGNGTGSGAGENNEEAQEPGNGTESGVGGNNGGAQEPGNGTESGVGGNNGEEQEPGTGSGAGENNEGAQEPGTGSDTGEDNGEEQEPGMGTDEDDIDDDSDVPVSDADMSKEESDENTTDEEKTVAAGEDDLGEAEFQAVTFQADDIANGYSGDTIWSIDKNGKLMIEGSGDFAKDSVSVSGKPRWYDYRERIRSAEVSMTGMSDLSDMFYDCDNMTSVTFTTFDTSYVEDMSRMFYYCDNLRTLDVSGFDTTYVANMSSMFYLCNDLRTLDVSGFNTENVTNMSSMFYGCSSLRSLDVSNFNTAQVTNMSNMFAQCNLIPALDISGFNTENVTNMAAMFSGCASLQGLEFKENFNTSKVTHMGSMFSGCSSLPELDVSGFNTENVLNMLNMFASCSSLTTLDLSAFNTEKVTNMGQMFVNCTNLTTLNVRNFDTQRVSNMNLMFYNCESLLELDISNFVTGNVTNMRYMFSGCKSLVTLNLDNFVTNRVTDMGYMFSGCSSLTELDLSSFDTSAVNYMIGMFSGCSSLGNLDLSGFNTENVRLMSYMFNNCSSLKNLDVSNFATSNAQYAVYTLYPSNSSLYYGGMEYMFNNCNNLSVLDVSSFETENVRFMNNMFSGCGGIKELKLDTDKFNTGTVTTMASMFSGCNRLLDLDVSKFNTGNVTDMNSMFKGCNSLGSEGSGEADGVSVVKFDVSSFVTTNVTDMSEMFSRCNSLLHLDISNFDTANVTDMQGMFFLCINLQELDFSSFNTVKVTDMHDMFYSCRALTELDLSSFDAVNTEDVWCLLEECSGLKIIYTPINLALTAVLPKDAPDDEWYQSGKYNNTVTSLPQNLDHSIMLIKNKEFEYPCIIVRKTKTVYNRGEELNLDDLTVTYYDINGNPTEIEDGYTTNADEIDMRKSDKATLKVTYIQDGQELSDTVELTITGKMKVIISGIDIDNVTYSATPVAYTGQPVVTLEIDGTVLPYSEVTLMYGYGGRLADGTVYPYTSSGNPPVDAGVYYLRVSVAEDNAYYIGDTVIPFDIYQAPVTITTDDVSVTVNSELPDSYTYKVEGLLNGKTLDTEPSFECDADISKIGMYYIVPSGADAGNNYDISYNKGILTVTGKRVVNISGITAGNVLYSAKPYAYRGEPVVTVSGSGEIVTEDVGGLLYTYSGILADGSTIYEKSSVPPVNAGTYTLRVEVPADNESYFGSREYTFTIAKMPVNITAKSVTLDMGDALPAVYEYEVSGLLEGKKLDVEPTVTCDAEDTLQDGVYIIEVSGADAGDNYEITYYNGVLTINGGEFNVEDIPRQIFTGKKLKPEVRVYAADGVTLLKVNKDYTVKYYNNVNADTEKESLRRILPSRDGSADNGFTKGMAYVVVKGKGNYKGTVYRNFYIDPRNITEDGVTAAEGFKLKCNEQLVSGKKSQKPFQSIKYKTSMKVDKDYTLTLTALEAYNSEGKELEEGEKIGEGRNTLIPADYYGTFELAIKGINNYAKTLTKTIYVTDKEHLMKNAKIALGRNLREVEYRNGDGIILAPGYYDSTGKIYYAINEEGMESQADKRDVFTVKVGKKYLKYGEDYDVIYSENDRVGTATMTIVGKAGYMGTKSAGFKIKGKKFSTRNITVENLYSSMRYNGTERTQENVVLTDNTDTGDGGAKRLELNKDYRVTYKNNLNKGTAVMTFTGISEAGYSGSFKKSFRIEPADLSKDISVTARDSINDSIEAGESGDYHLNGVVVYAKEGAKPSDRIRLIVGEHSENPVTLTEGTDYSVKYKNTDSAGNLQLPSMIMTGIGNYNGSINITFDISKAEMQENKELSVTVTALPYNAKKDAGYKYQPKIKVMDGKGVLKESKEYTVTLHRNTQAEVEAYFQAKDEGKSEEVLNELKPYAVITAAEGSDYTGSIEADLIIYNTKLSKNKLYVVIPNVDAQTVYTGEQLKPEIEVYYGDAKAVKAASKAEITNSVTLTDAKGEYKLTKLKLDDGTNCGDYTLEYGSNIKVGKKKGIIKVVGAGLYGGKVEFRFNIQGKDVYDNKVEPWSAVTNKIKAVFTW